MRPSKLRRSLSSFEGKQNERKRYHEAESGQTLVAGVGYHHLLSQMRAKKGLLGGLLKKIQLICNFWTRFPLDRPGS